MEYFRIKNWDKYQEEIKSKKNGHDTLSRYNMFLVHTDILDDPKTYNMSALEFMIWVKLMAVGRQLGNRIPLDKSWLRARLGINKLNKRLDLAFLWELELIEAIPVCLIESKLNKTKGARSREADDGPLAHSENYIKAKEVLKKL